MSVSERDNISIMKRSVDALLSDSIPSKSRSTYEKAWKEFAEFVDKPNEKPNEEDFLQFFDYLKTEKNFVASSIWAIYSRLNAMFQLKHGDKLQIYPRVTQLLKSYEENYQRSVASTFTKDQLSTFLENEELCTPYWITRKVIAVLMISGGLRMQELKNLNFGDLVKKNDCYEVKFKRLKQRGEKNDGKFIVNADMSRHITKYLCDLKLQFGDEVKGQFIKGTPLKQNGTSTFVNQNMGKNTLCDIGKDIAKALNLPNPSSYTSHTFRRSAATIAVESGSTTQELKNHFGWTSEKTADRYVDNSNVLATKMSDRLSVIENSSTTTINSTFNSSPLQANKYYKITAEAGSSLHFH